MSAQSSNSLVLYDRIADPVTAIVTLGSAIAKSRMFGCENVEQGQVFAMECLARKVPPLTLAMKYHVIFGKLSQKADDMLAEFIRVGGRSKIVERTSNRAAVQLTFGGDEHVFSFTWEDAQQEPFIYDGKDSEVLKLLMDKNPKAKKPTLKTKYATPRSRMQMLWARVVSDGIRAMCGSNSGLYTPEELEDENEGRFGGPIDAEFTVMDETAAAVKPAKKTAEELLREKAAKHEATTNAAKNDATANATATTLADQAKEEVKPVTDIDMGENAVAAITLHQRDYIRELYKELFPADHLERIEKATKKRGVSDLRSFTHAQALELIANLEAAKAQKAEEEKSKNVAVESDGAKTTTNNAPCTAVQIDGIKSVIREMEQQSPGTATKFAGLLRASGRERIADFTIEEAARCDNALRSKQMEAYFAESLAKKVKGGDVPKDDIPFAK